MLTGLISQVHCNVCRSQSDFLITLGSQEAYPALSGLSVRIKPFKHSLWAGTRAPPTAELSKVLAVWNWSCYEFHLAGESL